jgi:hypothetical protein
MWKKRISFSVVYTLLKLDIDVIEAAWMKPEKPFSTMLSHGQSRHVRRI